MIKMDIKADTMGILTSIICAIHCVILPFFMTSLPFFGMDLLENKWLEIVLIIVSVVVGGYSFLHGYRHHHGRKLPAVMFAVGFICLVINQITRENYLFLLIPVAATMMIMAHYLNLRFRKGPQKNSIQKKPYAV
jgi:hypothetical protein